jgi:hypothetical protein
VAVGDSLFDSLLEIITLINSVSIATLETSASIHVTAPAMFSTHLCQELRDSNCCVKRNFTEI